MAALPGSPVSRGRLMVDSGVLDTNIVLVLCLLGGTIVLFSTEFVRVDVAAICIMVFLGLSSFLPGVTLIGTDIVFAGFASNAVISVIAVMIIGGGLDRAGLMNRLASLILAKGGHKEGQIIPLIAGTVALISSFMQNIGAAALFLPVVDRIARRTGLPLSRLLMPMGFCAILGGTATMIGSSPLILLNDLLLSANEGLPDDQQMSPFGLFSVTPIGIALVLVGILYFVLAGRWVLPAVKTSGTAQGARAREYFKRVYGISGELLEARLSDNSPLAGKTIHAIEESVRGTPKILAYYNGDTVKVPPDREETLWVGTQLGLMGNVDDMRLFCHRHHWDIGDSQERFTDVLNAQHAGIAEIVVPPGSSLVGQRIGEVKPRRNFGTNILTIYRTESVIDRGFRNVILQPGDTLVVHGTWKDLHRLSKGRELIVATDVPYEHLRTDKVRQALACFAAALLLFALSNSLSISLLTGAIGMVLTGVLTIDEAYAAVSWQTVFLLASLIPLGIAVDQTGTAAWIAHHILHLAGDVDVWVIQAVIATLATFFTLVMSNIGATVLLVPLAINLALVIGADPAVFALTVAICTSNSFLIPTHQVNALLMGPGGYRVVDFLVAGGLMTVLFLIVSLTMLNVIF